MGLNKTKRAPPRAKTIAFFEPRCTGVTHLEVTAAIIDMFSKIFPEHSLVFYTEETHGGFTKKRTAAKFEQININPPQGPRNRWEWLKEVFWDFTMMRKIRNIKPEYIVCMGYTWEIVLFAKLFQRKQKIVFFFHSIEKEIKQNVPAYRPAWWFWRSLEWEIKAHVQMVFGESILREISKIRPALKFRSIDHPHIPCYDATVPINIVTSPPSKFAAISSANVMRDISILFVLEKKLGKMPENFELHSRAMVDGEGKIGDVKIPNDSKIKFITTPECLSPEGWDAYINMMDFCMFFYPQNSYLFTASGALLEALAHLKPVVALHNSYLDYVFNKMGDIGYLCDTVDEMAASIRKAVLGGGGGEHYNAQRQNIMNGLKLFSPEYLAGSMRSILSELDAPSGGSQQELF
ncbi:MAG: hypothetical protein LBB47_02720 [Spirochaetaceae bacterium]|jgi:glycosyltransferase involved in cell wall biosynthesis|nr:hypothetical protein [Spirochaetaceae bacterium]